MLPLTDKQKHLQFQATRRSTREMEELLQGFLDERLAGLSDDDCDRVVSFLNGPDVLLYDWISGVKSPPPEVDKTVLQWLRLPSRP